MEKRRRTESDADSVLSAIQAAEGPPSKKVASEGARRKRRTPTQNAGADRRAESPSSSNGMNEAAEDDVSRAEGGPIEEAWRMAHLATQLMSIYPPRMFGIPEGILNTSDPKWSVYFGQIAQLAELLLKQCLSRDVDIHAYRVFLEGTVMTEEEIMTAFKAAGWRGLKSKTPVMHLMKDLRTLLSKECSAQLDRLPAQDAVNQGRAWAAIQEAILKLKRDSDVIAVYPGFAEAATRLTEWLNQPRSLGLDVRPEAEAHENIFWFEQFFAWCFPESDDPDRRHYRPHEIFQFAASQGWAAEKLIRSRSALSPEFIPFPEKSLEGVWSSESYSVFHGERGRAAWRSFPTSGIDDERADSQEDAEASLPQSSSSTTEMTGASENSERV